MEQISGQRKEGRGRDRCERRLEEKKGEINYCGGTVQKREEIFSPDTAATVTLLARPRRGPDLESVGSPSEAFHVRGA